MEKALGKIGKLAAVKAAPVMIRVENFEIAMGALLFRSNQSAIARR